MSPKVVSSSRALAAILPLIESSQAYEAHQKARTFASRYVKSGQNDTAIDVLFQTARELLKVGQTGSGVDLAGFLLDVYETKGEGVGEESRSRWTFPKKIPLAQLIDWASFLFPLVTGRLTQLIALTGPSGTWRKTLIDKAVALVYFDAAVLYINNWPVFAAGQRNMEYVPQAIRTSNTTSASFSIKACSLFFPITYSHGY
jgi:hypothetical protein